MVCPECNGRGKAIYYVETDRDENTVTVEKREDICRTCNGSGEKPQTNADSIRAMIDAEQAFLKVREENKTLRRQLEIMTKDRDYYRDAYHHLLREGKE